ncbi:MAG TPA: diacylglycerol kinase family protein [Solirubrobacteraceae bacterium]|nr:diacylglycerol kinase family protein [Solirubrobacteraceae bacterium]
MPPARLIVNPSAGGGRAGRVLPDVEAALTAAGVDHSTHRTRDLPHARELARDAATDGAVAIALGGDGLVGAVAAELAGHPGGRLAVLPGGRGNDFARALEIPEDPIDACSVVASGVYREIDLGSVDGRYFACIASAGFDSDANRIANAAPSWLGGQVYTYGALRALAAWKPATFTIELDGTARTYRGYSIIAANSSCYGGGMRIAPDAALDDGLLDVVLTEHIGRVRFLLKLGKVFKGTHVREPNVHVLRGSELWISCDRPFAIYADGDPIGELPVTVRAHPSAVRVLVPAT